MDEGEAGDPRATALLRAAREAQYRWPARCKGITAGVSVRVDGSLVDGGGRVRCHALGGVTFRPGRAGVLDAGLVGEVVRFAGSLLHREPEGARFRPGLDRRSGRAVELVDEAQRQVAWISGGRITESELTVGPSCRQLWVLAEQAVAVGVTGRRVPRLVAERITTPGGERCHDIVDDWDVVGPVVVPARRRIDVQRPDRRRIVVELHDHRLNER